MNAREMLRSGNPATSFSVCSRRDPFTGPRALSKTSKAIPFCWAMVLFDALRSRTRDGRQVLPRAMFVQLREAVLSQRKHRAAV